ncbi:1657_t:CDS:1, partial [Funneliformis caledonium]
MIVEFSPKKFHELKVDIRCCVNEKREFQWLNPIFKCWSNRVSRIPLSLTIHTNLYTEFGMNESKLIEKFKKLGVFKEIKILNDVPEYINMYQ